MYSRKKGRKAHCLEHASFYSLFVAQTGYSFPAVLSCPLERCEWCVRVPRNQFCWKRWRQSACVAGHDHWDKMAEQEGGKAGVNHQGITKTYQESTQSEVQHAEEILEESVSQGLVFPCRLHCSYLLWMHILKVCCVSVVVNRDQNCFIRLTENGIRV